ncbi:MAG: PAS domain S-box protein, partial [Deltaproteobacteria bacterium]|nr:PAS domain S-box protein [Deltaproteobacteria bacterium]
MTRTTGPAEPSPRSAELEARINALEMELAQKDALLTQGFDVFTDAAEKLQDSYKRLQKKVDELNLELDRKNKELELNLEEKEKVKTYLSNIFSSLAIGVVVTSLDGRVTGLNRTLVEMLGVTDEQARGMTVGGLLGVDIPLPDLESGGSAGRKSNEEELDEPITYTAKDRDPLKLQISASTMRGENGEPLGFIFNIQDVTELKRLEEHADRRNRFTAMGEMAANIAHEIRNPLGSIELFAALLKKGL